MAYDFGLTQVPGDPDAVKVAAANLHVVAGDMNRYSGAINAEAGGISAAWRDANGTAAADEATKLSSLVGQYETHIAAGASALKTYAAALERAQQEITGLQGKAQLADTHARSVAAKKWPAHGVTELLSTVEYIVVLSEGLAPLRHSYADLTSTLTTAAKTCQAALSGAVPGFTPGMTSAQFQGVTQDAVLLQLPSAAKEQAKTDAEILKYQASQGWPGKDDPYLKTVLARIKLESTNQAYADAFAADLGADGILKLPAELANPDNRGDLSDGERADLMRSLANVVGAATNTTANPDHLADDQIQQLITAASNTDYVDAGEKGGMWRPEWAMKELLAYSANWGPKFLSDVSTEIYNNRGKLQDLEPSVDELPISSQDNGHLNDPMLVALQKLDDNGAAGRLFFDAQNAAGEPDRIRILMAEYSQKEHDQEGWLVHAIQKAAVDLPPGQRTGDDGKRAADIASWFLHDAALEATGKGNYGAPILWNETQGAVTHILAAYYGDVTRTLRDGGSFDPGQGSYTVTSDPLFNGQSGADMSYGDLSQLLSTVTKDGGQRQVIYGAAASYTNADLQLAIAQHQDIGNAYVTYGADLRRMLDAAHLVDGKNAQDQKEMLGILQVASGVGGVYMPAGASVGEITANALNTMKALGDGSLGFVDPTGAEGDDYQARLAQATNGGDNILITSVLHYGLESNASLDPTQNTGLSWTDNGGTSHSFYNPTTNTIDPPPQSSGDYDKFTKWYNDLLGSGSTQEYRQNFDNGFDHPPNAG